jgi:hypothetical protein
MEELLPVEKYLLSLLLKLEKGLRICVEELGLEDPLDLEGEGHRTMDVLVLHLVLVLAPHAMRQALEAVIALGRTLLHQGGGAITQLRQKEGKILEDHQDLLLSKTAKSTALLAGRILLVMMPIMLKPGQEHLGLGLGRHLVLDPGLLRICLLLPADRPEF